MNQTFEITELHKRISNLIKIGKIAETDLSGDIPLARVQSGDLLSDWLPIVAVRAGTDKNFWPYDIGEQVLIFSLSGDFSQGYIFGSINYEAFPANGSSEDIHRSTYADGAVIEYDRNNKKLTASLPASATIDIVSDGGITITGDVNVTGNITATGNVSDGTRSMAADRDIYNEHTHPGVQSGSSSTQVTTSQQ